MFPSHKNPNNCVWGLFLANNCTSLRSSTFFCATHSLSLKSPFIDEQLRLQCCMSLLFLVLIQLILPPLPQKCTTISEISNSSFKKMDACLNRVGIFFNASCTICYWSFVREMTGWKMVAQRRARLEKRACFRPGFNWQWLDWWFLLLLSTRLTITSWSLH